jgi:hypothetical protein
MTDPCIKLIERIHAAPLQSVIAVTGGGATAISELFSVPGGSRTILEAIVPYSAAAISDWLGRQPEHFCVEDTALAMASVAYRRAGELARIAEGNALLVGLACTASLASDRPKKGEHRCYVATQTKDETRSWSLILAKGARDRMGEEQLVAQLVLRSLGCAAGLSDLTSPGLVSGEKIVEQRAVADPLLVELLAGQRGIVWSLPAHANGSESQIRNLEQIRGLTPPARHVKSEVSASLSDQLATFPPPAGLLCGAFNPLHDGHKQLRAAAERQLGGPVYYEMSIRNVDKPPLDFLSIERRRAQFSEQPLALTTAPTFAEKAVALPRVVFVVGVDTALRIVEPRYYGGSAAAMRDALSQFDRAGCRFLVAGRKVAERFATLADVAVPEEFTGLFRAISPDEFRVDISATELRRRQSL